jgi:hypothetical protein
LCELYIDFARKHGYNIIVSGNHKKIYSGWKLPHVKDNDFKTRSLGYILENLDRIIENKIKNKKKSLEPDSDSEGNSPERDIHDEKYRGRYRSYLNSKEKSVTVGTRKYSLSIKHKSSK